MFALYLPVMERVYEKVQCYGMVMEMQIIMEAEATASATVGMAWEGGFSKMKEEPSRMVFLTCSLPEGICVTALLSMNVLGGLVVFRDNFGGFKAVSTILCIWGFCSHVYGIYKFRNNNSNH
ncbi:hypothetical protein Fmac_008900 [Flemingia macrophylla]|uniref:Uncharacterized protein n=1 Tax=Flemingia macrophylla TaxID=520843 RepID=A0ABD1MYP8_9FABA